MSDDITLKDEVFMTSSKEYLDETVKLAEKIRRRSTQDTPLTEYVKRFAQGSKLKRFVKDFSEHPKSELTGHAKQRCRERCIDEEMTRLARSYGEEIRPGLFRLSITDFPYDKWGEFSDSFKKRLEKVLPICAAWEHSKTSNDIICTTAYRLFENDTRHKHRTNWKRGKPGAKKHKW
jgi:hypothetical protein